MKDKHFPRKHNHLPKGWIYFCCYKKIIFLVKNTMCWGFFLPLFYTQGKTSLRFHWQRQALNVFKLALSTLKFAEISKKKKNSLKNNEENIKVKFPGLWVLYKWGFSPEVLLLKNKNSQWSRVIRKCDRLDPSILGPPKHGLLCRQWMVTFCCNICHLFFASL